jgi:hypothetical protein
LQPLRIPNEKTAKSNPEYSEIPNMLMNAREMGLNSKNPDKIALGILRIFESHVKFFVACQMGDLGLANTSYAAE